MKSSLLICPVCETENEAGTRNCILCGAALPLPLSPSLPPASSPSKPPPPAPALTSPPPSVSPTSRPTAAVSPLRPAGKSPLAEIEQALDELLPLPDLLDEKPVPSGLRPSSPSSSGSLPSQASKRPADTELFPGVPAPAKAASLSGAVLSKPPASPIPRGATPTPDSSRSGGFSRAQLPPLDIPEPGTLCLIVYFQRKPAQYFPVVYDEILIGRTDPASNAYPDLDLTPFDPELAISRKHSYVYREQTSYYIYPISNSGTQVNQEMVDLGTKRLLKEGDVIILSGRLAIRFARVS